jgi:alcohol dehydrogenase class IV
MTLITYPTRVHFADHVLEEALHSELEDNGCKRPLLIADRQTSARELADRGWSGLPRNAQARNLTFDDDADLGQLARAHFDRAAPVDAIIAYGTARAIELGRKCRYVHATKIGKRPLFVAIPGVDGLPNPCTRNLESWRAGLPSILICDPTVAVAAGQGASHRTSVLSFARCIESYLAEAYNPLADGIALEGVRRCVTNMPKIGQKSDIGLSRELMAAGLNAALAQEKGSGPALAISTELAKGADAKDLAAIARLVLPAVTQARAIDPEKVNALNNVLGDGEETLGHAMQRILSNMPMPTSLAAIGVPRSALAAAAKTTSGRAGLTHEHALRALESIYERPEQ